MSFPVYVRVGGLSLHPHAVFETLAYAGGFYCYLRERRRIGDVLTTERRTGVVVAAVLGGLVGARLMYLAENPHELASHWRDLTFLLAGKSIVGALLGGMIAVEVIKRRLGIAVGTGDVLALPLILGIAIGRVGCFLSGLPDRTYGVATGLPWGVDFGDGIARHPTQLYEIGFLAVLAAVLAVRGKRLAVVGDRFRLFMLAYLCFRLGVDFIKPGIHVGGLTAIQWACLAAVAYYAPHVPRLALELGHG